MSYINTSDMAEIDWSPTVIIGIDFGMTYTGVAFTSRDDDWARPEVLQKWPDREGRLYNKWPSRVAYNGKDAPVDWGKCDVTEEDARVEREFKLYLDQAFFKPYLVEALSGTADDFLDHKDAVRYYIDYMSKLHDHLEKVFERRYRPWHQRQVEYRFSIPTTWTSPELTNQLRRWLAKAGFIDSVKANRRVIVSQTEAEAAAVYAAKTYQQGDIILVVDAGGATTDLNILEVARNSDHVAQMKALDKAEGINIGSVLIDTEIRSLIAKKLEDLEVEADDELKWLAEDMMESSGFERYKCEFKDDDVSLDHHLKIPDHDPNAGPSRRVVLKSIELKGVFEPLVNRLISFIEGKIRSLEQTHPESQLRFIVLSGGLGSSMYVRKRLVAKFCGALRPSNAQGLEILTAFEPQLAVVKGLVMDRSQKLHQGQTVYTTRYSRVSYGTLVTLPYDKQKHLGEQPVRHPNTGELIVKNQIDWFIKEGDFVPEQGILRQYTVTFPKHNEPASLVAHILMCERPHKELPSSLSHGRAIDLCTVTGRFAASDFASEDFDHVKGKGWRLRRNDLIRAHVNLKVMVESTDLRFEFVSLSGHSFSQSTKPVQVEWFEYPPTTRGTSR